MASVPVTNISELISQRFVDSPSAALTNVTQLDSGNVFTTENIAVPASFALATGINEGSYYTFAKLQASSLTINAPAGETQFTNS